MLWDGEEDGGDDEIVSEGIEEEEGLAWLGVEVDGASEPVSWFTMGMLVVEGIKSNTDGEAGDVEVKPALDDDDEGEGTVMCEEDKPVLEMIDSVKNDGFETVSCVVVVAVLGMMVNDDDDSVVKIA